MAYKPTYTLHAAKADADHLEDRRAGENRESRDFIDRLLHQTGKALFTFDLEGRIQRASQSAVEISGYGLEELINSPLSVIFSLETLPQISEQFAKASVHGRVLSEYETEIIRKDGNTRSIIFNATHFYRDGKIAGLVGTAEDITRQRQADERFRLLAETATDGIIIMGEDKCISLWNPAAERIFGFTAGEALGKEMHPLLVPPDASKAFEHGFKHFLKTGNGPIIGKTLELNALRKGGVEFPVELTISALKINGKWNAMGIFRDITERKKAEEQLRDKTRRLLKAQHVARMGFLEWNLKTNKMYWSDEIYNLYGIDKEKTGASIDLTMQLVHPDDLAFAKENLDRAISGGKAYDINHRILRPDARVLWVHAQAETVCDKEGNPESLLGTVVDITDRKMAEEGLEASLKEKELLLKELRHRVGNNLQAIISLLRIQGRRTSNKQYSSLLQDIQQRIRTMALVHEKLYSTRSFSHLDLGRYVKSLAKELCISYGVTREKVALKLDMEDILLDIKYAIPCGLIINELLSNSIKHAFPGDIKGEIAVGLRMSAEDEIDLSISDDGIGLPEGADICSFSDTMGMDLVRTMVEHELGGSIELATTEGTKYRIRFSRQTDKGGSEKWQRQG